MASVGPKPPEQRGFLLSSMGLLRLLIAVGQRSSLETELVVSAEPFVETLADALAMDALCAVSKHRPVWLSFYWNDRSLRTNQPLPSLFFRLLLGVLVWQIPEIEPPPLVCSAAKTSNGRDVFRNDEAALLYAEDLRWQSTLL